MENGKIPPNSFPHEAENEQLRKKLAKLEVATLGSLASPPRVFRGFLCALFSMLLAQRFPLFLVCRHQLLRFLSFHIFSPFVYWKYIERWTSPFVFWDFCWSFAHSFKTFHLIHFVRVLSRLFVPSRRTGLCIWVRDFQTDQRTIERTRIEFSKRNCFET